jgi:putative flippase GtrA
MMSPEVQEVNAEPISGRNSAWNYVQQRWERFPLSKRVSTRLLKFVLVGGSGVLVNLVAMALLLRLAGWKDWRVSAIANVIATLSNYLLNNHWTFRDRRRTGLALTGGAFLYMITSAAGIAFTTASYGFLTKIHFRGGPMTSYIQLMGMQLIAVLAGAYLNYFVHNSFTWRESGPVNRNRGESGNYKAGAIPDYADTRNRTLKSFSSSSSGPSAVVLPE